LLLSFFFFYFHFLWFLKNYSIEKTLIHLYSNLRVKNLFLVFFIFIFFLFLPLNKKINLKRVKSISKSRDVTSLEEEFMFQPEIEKNSQEQGSIRLGPRTRRGGTSSSTSCREASRFSYRSPSFTTTREPRERKRLPQPMRMTPLRVYVLRA